MTGLCPGCTHVRVIESASGSRFLMCRLAKEDPRFAKYPPQPVVRCRGHEAASAPEGPKA
ncbi:MAG: hypothetical protein MK297_02765 [Planctomycetes bacterium]|nr:hypothetical protein [Planctomycetota bacterium]